MMSDEEEGVMYCQYELQSNSFSAFEEMRKKGNFCDLTIKVQNRFLTAHRMVLAAGIPYFKNSFSGVKTEEVALDIENVELGVIETLITFAYTGKVMITSENVQSLLRASQFLQLGQVHEACTAFLAEKIDDDNAAEVRSLACSLNNINLIQNSDLYIRKNFDEFSKRDDFLNFPHSCIKEIISNDDLKVLNEEIVFEALMNWVKLSPSKRHIVLPDLLKEVRLIYLPLDYLINRVDAEELIASSKPCRDLVNKVKYYHLLPEKSLALSSLKTKPRNNFKKDLYAICACVVCGYSVHHFDVDHKIWHVASAKKVQYKGVNGAVTVNGKIYIFPDKTILTFNPKADEWEVLDSEQEGIEGAAIVSNKNRIYCFGSKESNLKTRILCYDTQKHMYLQEGRMRLGREYPAATSLDEFIYITGGYDGRKCLDTAEKYNPATGEWIDIAPMLVGRRNHCCTSMNGKIYVCGGSGSLESAEVYDPLTNEWSFIPSLRSKYCRLLVSDHSKIYALGDSEYKTYSPKSDRCKPCTSSLPGGFAHAVSIPTNIQNGSV